jgi:breast cancer 2 susceptibility protein
MVDITVIKAFPVAYIEFVEDADGTKRREGPRTEKDERQADEKWKVGSQKLLLALKLT